MYQELSTIHINCYVSAIASTAPLSSPKYSNSFARFSCTPPSLQSKERNGQDTITCRLRSAAQTFCNSSHRLIVSYNSYLSLRTIQNSFRLLFRVFHQFIRKNFSWLLPQKNLRDLTIIQEEDTSLDQRFDSPHSRDQEPSFFESPELASIRKEDYSFTEKDVEKGSTLHCPYWPLVCCYIPWGKPSQRIVWLHDKRRIMGLKMLNSAHENCSRLWQFLRIS